MASGAGPRAGRTSVPRCRPLCLLCFTPTEEQVGEEAFGSARTGSQALHGWPAPPVIAVTWVSIGRDEYPTCVGFLVSSGDVRCSVETENPGKAAKMKKMHPRKTPEKRARRGASRGVSSAWGREKKACSLFGFTVQPSLAAASGPSGPLLLTRMQRTLNAPWSGAMPTWRDGTIPVHGSAAPNESTGGPDPAIRGPRDGTHRQGTRTLSWRGLRKGPARCRSFRICKGGLAASFCGHCNIARKSSRLNEWTTLQVVDFLPLLLRRPDGQEAAPFLFDRR